MAGYCGLLQGFLVSWRPPSGRAKDFESGRPGPAAPDVVDISSDEEEEEDDVSPPVARRLRFDDAADDGVCDLVLKKGESGGADGAGEDDGDCVVLDSDPDGAIAVADEDGAAESDGSSDELQIVAEKGQVACRDFPHPRHLCSNMPFGASTSHEKHCTMCYCFVCDAPAPCAYWGEGLLIDDHCHATDKETKWRTLRQEFKCKKLPTSHPEKENLVYPTMVRPTVMSVGRLSLANRSPLRNVVNQNQETHTSVRAQLIVEPTACAPSTARRAGCGTSNAHTGQITHLVEPTISAPRPHPVIRARSGTSNAHAAQVTRPLEPTVSAAMPHPAIRDGSVASNAHTAQITQPVHPTVSEPRANLVTRAARDTHNGYTSQISHRVEQTVSASRKYAATRAARHASNAHTAENTYPPTAFSYLSELDRHKEDGEYMTEEEYTRDGTKVYVGNLPYNIRNRALALSFEHAGAVLSSKVIYNRETGQSRGFGFVTMSTVQEAERAVRIYHGYELYDRRLIVRKVVPRGTAALRQESYQHEVDVEYTCEDDDELLEEAMVYVGNLHYDIDNLYLAELFEYAGTVEHAKVIYNRNTHQSRGFGFVTMSTVRQADRAMRIYHGYEVYGRRLSVHKAAHRTRGARVETPRRSANDNATLRSRGFRMFDTPRRRSVNNATPRSRGFHFRMGTPRHHSTNKAATPGSRVESPRRGCWHRFGIYVANLPWQVDDSWLGELFGGHGAVVDARVVCERRGGAWRSRGFGFVTMATEEATYDAVYALDKQILEGRTLLVEVAKERPRRGFY